jgi:hypothetical protein
MEETIELGKVELTNTGSYVKSNCSGVGNITSSGQIGSIGGVGSGGTGGINTNSYITYTYAYPQTESYVVFKLPWDEMPNKVYVNGRLMTLGKLGADVQAAYDNEEQLVFRLGELNNASVYASNTKITVSVEYEDTMFHYNVKHINGQITFLPNTNIVDAVLVSEVDL